MATIRTVCLTGVLALVVLAITPASVRAAHGTIDPNLPSTWRPVVFLVNGFGGCCIPDIPGFPQEPHDPTTPTDVVDWLGHLRVDENGDALPAGTPGTAVAIHEANWNALDPNADGAPGAGCFNPGDPSCSPRPDAFDHFVKELSDWMRKVPAEIKVLLIGHSLGAEAVLRVAQAVGDRPIAFLGTLDPVGWGGLRATVTSAEMNPWGVSVPSNVEYLFNRWQITNPYPLENAGLVVPPIVGQPPTPPGWGQLRSHARRESQRQQNERRRSDCSIKYPSWDELGLFPQLLEHQNVPYDRCINRRMIDAMRSWVFNGNPFVIQAEPVMGYARGWVRAIVGVRVVFSKPIDPASFTVDDVVDSLHPVQAIEPGADGQAFLVRFADPFETVPGFTPYVRLVIGPDIRDDKGRPMDQDRDAIAGELEEDRYSYEVGETITLPDESVVTFKTLQYLEGKLWDLAFTFEQPIDHAVATDLNFYHLVAAGADAVLGTPDDEVVGLTAAQYDAEGRTVTLSLETPLAAGGRYRLIAAAEGRLPVEETFTIPTLTLE